MDYRYLKEWVWEDKKDNKQRTIYEIRRGGDSLALFFKGEANYLQIVLDSTKPFLFYSSRKTLSFRKDNKIEIFNQHLVHCRLESVDISESDRIIICKMHKRDIYNQLVSYRLILELIPHKVNLILTRRNDEQDLIIDCWHYITLSSRSARQLLPGSRYELPVKPDHKSQAKDNSYLMSVQYPLHLNEIVSPKLDLEESIANKEFIEMNSLFEFFFFDVILPQRNERNSAHQIKILQKQKEKKEAKIGKLLVELEDSKRSEEYKKMAELLKINLHKIEKGMSEIRVTDYYTGEDQKLTIPLQPELSAIENMKLLFKKYRKGSSGRGKIKEQITRTQEEIDQFEKEIFDLENRVIDIDNQDHFPVNKESIKNSAKKPQKKERFRRLKINENWEIFIGRTNRENDELTCRMAKPDDWWFHTRIFHGAHILLRNYHKLEISPDLIHLCSRLAAYFSKAKKSENVPVDYTQIRYVTKPHGSPAGYVIYKNQKTVYVNPISLRDAVRQIHGVVEYP